MSQSVAASTSTPFSPGGGAGALQAHVGTVRAQTASPMGESERGGGGEQRGWRPQSFQRTHSFRDYGGVPASSFGGFHQGGTSPPPTHNMPPRPWSSASQRDGSEEDGSGGGGGYSPSSVAPSPRTSTHSVMLRAPMNTPRVSMVAASSMGTVSPEPEEFFFELGSTHDTNADKEPPPPMPHTHLLHHGGQGRRSVSPVFVHADIPYHPGTFRTEGARTREPQGRISIEEADVEDDVEGEQEHVRMTSLRSSMTAAAAHGGSSHSTFPGHPSRRRSLGSVVGVPGGEGAPRPPRSSLSQRRKSVTNVRVTVVEPFG